MEVIKFAKLHPDAKIPTKGSEKAAGYDLYAHTGNPVIIDPHTTVKIGTGLSIQPPAGHFGAIFPRSGLSTKHGLRPANCVGVCDEDYTGEYIVAVHNDTNYTQTIEHEERIAQLVFIPYQPVDFVQVEKLDETERGNCGFGSTGRK